jgi:hypothetical protein
MSERIVRELFKQELARIFLQNVLALKIHCSKQNLLALEQLLNGFQVDTTGILFTAYNFTTIFSKTS